MKFKQAIENYTSEKYFNPFSFIEGCYDIATILIITVGILNFDIVSMLRLLFVWQTAELAMDMIDPRPLYITKIGAINEDSRRLEYMGNLSILLVMTIGEVLYAI